VSLGLQQRGLRSGAGSRSGGRGLLRRGASGASRIARPDRHPAHRGRLGPQWVGEDIGNARKGRHSGSRAGGGHRGRRHDGLHGQLRRPHGILWPRFRRLGPRRELRRRDLQRHLCSATPRSRHGGSIGWGHSTPIPGSSHGLLHSLFHGHVRHGRHRPQRGEGKRRQEPVSHADRRINIGAGSGGLLPEAVRV